MKIKYLSIYATQSSRHFLRKACFLLKSLFPRQTLRSCICSSLKFFENKSADFRWRNQIIKTNHFRIHIPSNTLKDWVMTSSFKIRNILDTGYWARASVVRGDKSPTNRILSVLWSLEGSWNVRLTYRLVSCAVTLSPFFTLLFHFDFFISRAHSCCTFSLRHSRQSPWPETRRVQFLQAFLSARLGYL